MGFGSKDEGEELDDQKEENMEDERDDDLRENKDDGEWDDIDWGEDNSGEQEESIWNDIDWGEDNSGEQEESIWNDIDWGEDSSGEQKESIWNEIDWGEDSSGEQEGSIWNKIDWGEDNSGEQEESIWNDIDWNEHVTGEQGKKNEGENPDDEFEPEQFDPDENEEESEEGYQENIGSQSTSTVIVAENKEDMQELGQEELEKEVEKELEEGVEAINKYLEEEAEFINAYQEMVAKARELEEEREREGGERHKTDEEWEKEAETAAYTAEQLYESMKEIKTKTNDEEISERNEETEQLEEQEEEEEEVEAQAINLKEETSELYEDLDEEEKELEQHQVEGFIEEELETEPEPIVNEEEIENLQELELEKQFHTVHFNDLINDLYEKQEEEKNKEEEKEQEKENIQEIKHQSTYLQEKLEEQEQELDLEYEEKEEVEQHQVEAAIEEELETEPKPIINEEELEYIKNLEPEKQLAAEVFYELIEELSNKQNEEKEEREEEEVQEEISTEQKVAQIKRELEIPQEINSDETEVETTSQEIELEENTIPDKEVEERIEVEENKAHQQELEEILEQNKKIEHEALVEIEQEEEDSDKTAEKNYESAKKLYAQQTGKRPIYANKETKGFKQWLEQKKKSEEKEKTRQKQEPKEEQKKEEAWKWSMKNWIVRATEIDRELKSELLKLVEKYKELEKLIKKYSQLYNKAQREKLSRAEKSELESLIKTLQKLDPIKIELFLGLREMKRYLDEQYYYHFWEPKITRIRHHFFTRLSQKYKSLKEVEKNKNIEKKLKNWIEKASEEEISLEMKMELIEIVENYDELEELAISFMELYKKEQLEQISQSEKIELKELIKTLQKLEPIKIELFANIRAIKRYLNNQQLDDFSNKTRVSQIFSRFLANFSQKYKNLAFNKQILLGKTNNKDNHTIRTIKKSTAYNFPVLRKKINKKILGMVWKELRNSGVRMKYLDKKLGITFKSLLSSGHSISNDVYEILNNFVKSILTPKTFYDLFGQNFIPYKITVGKSGKEIKVLNDSDLTDEFLAIMTGDGTLLTNGQTFDVALNSIDEERYVKYVRKLMEKLFPNAIIHEVKIKGKGIVLRINDISYHYALVCKGLIPGDKVKNQIRVPKINIINNINLNKWLKGLFDTDGTMYVKRRGMSIVLSFSSGSKQLVKDFKSICEILRIEPSSLIVESNYKSEITNVESIIYTTHIYKKESIKKFIQIIDPEKFKEPMRRLYIGSKLILRRSPKIIRQNVESRIKTLVPEKKKRRYSKLYALLLKKTIEESYREILNKNEFLITNKMIEKALHDVTKDKALSHYIKIENKKIRRFPSDIRNKICGMISKIFDMKITNEEEILGTLLRIFEDSNNSKLYELHELLNDKIIGKILKQYISILIGLVREIRRQSELGSIHVYTISRDFDINPKILISIIEDLKKKKYIQYDKPVVQKQPSKTSTDLYLEYKINIDNFIIKLRKKGLAYRQISKKAKKKFGFNITYWRVSKVIEESLSKSD